jgi:hypothetical protein
MELNVDPPNELATFALHLDVIKHRLTELTDRAIANTEGYALIDDQPHSLGFHPGSETSDCGPVPCRRSSLTPGESATEAPSGLPNPRQAARNAGKDA